MNLLNNLLNLTVAFGALGIIGAIAHHNGLLDQAADLPKTFWVAGFVMVVGGLFAIRELCNFNSSYLK